MKTYFQIFTKLQNYKINELFKVRFITHHEFNNLNKIFIY